MDFMDWSRVCKYWEKLSIWNNLRRRPVTALDLVRISKYSETEQYFSCIILIQHLRCKDPRSPLILSNPLYGKTPMISQQQAFLYASSSFNSRSPANFISHKTLTIYWRSSYLSTPDIHIGPISDAFLLLSEKPTPPKQCAILRTLGHWQ